MRFWKRDLNVSGTVGLGIKFVTAGEQTVNISRVGAEYNLAGVGPLEFTCPSSGPSLSAYKSSRGTAHVLFHAFKNMNKSNTL